MSKPELFKTAAGISVEISHGKARNEKGLLAVWPCTGGAFQMYRLPEERFLEMGISVLQFNPPGQGGSEGHMDYSLAVECFRECLLAKTDPPLPLIMTGHSGGAGASLLAVPEGRDVRRFILVSPVLDSRASLRYMYSVDTISEFSNLLASPLADKRPLLDILSDSGWMDPSVWLDLGLKEKLNNLSERYDMGTFLEKLFIQGFRVVDEMKKRARDCRILLAVNDNWYSSHEIGAMASEWKIPVTIVERARDHYFTGAWSDVWDFVLQEAVGGLKGISTGSPPAEGIDEIPSWTR